MRPHFSHVEDIPLVGFGILGIHDLHADVPGGILISFNGLVHVLDEIVGVAAVDLLGLFTGKVLNPLLALQVEFDIFEGSILVWSASVGNRRKLAVPLWSTCRYVRCRHSSYAARLEFLDR